MTTLFEAKLRRVGNSMGFIIPGEVVKKNGYREGDTIKVALLKHSLEERNRFILSIAGKLKGYPPFERDKEDRF
jgi:antitoxin component of MazEF toxin-antitoxin module